MLGLRKRANHTIGVAKIREFTTKGVYTGTFMQTRPFWTIPVKSSRASLIPQNGLKSLSKKSQELSKHAQEPTINTRAPLHLLKTVIIHASK